MHAIDSIIIVGITGYYGRVLVKTLIKNRLRADSGGVRTFLYGPPGN